MVRLMKKLTTFTEKDTTEINSLKFRTKLNTNKRRDNILLV